MTDVAVTGLGVVSPAGIGVPQTWAGLLSGRSPCATDPLLEGLPVDFACVVAGFDANALIGKRTAWRLDRFTQMAIAATQQAVADASLDPSSWEPDRVGVVIGVGSNSLERYEKTYDLLLSGRHENISPWALPRGVPNMAAGEISLSVCARGPSFTTSSACASAATAIGVARDLIRSGTCDVVIAGGAESVRNRMTAAAFWRMGALAVGRPTPAAASRPFDIDRTGFVLSEGAGILVLERPEHARARGARVHAVLAGYGASADAHHPTTPTPDGAGAVTAIRSALADAGLDPRDIDHVNAHATATPQGDLAEARALATAFGTPPPVTALKGVLGHSAGAAGAIEAVSAVLTLREGIIPPTANLDKLDPDVDLDVVVGHPRRVRMRAAISTSFGFGGQNAALAFKTV